MIVLSPQWDFLYWQNGIFTLNQPPFRFRFSRSISHNISRTLFKFWHSKWPFHKYEPYVNMSRLCQFMTLCGILCHIVVENQPGDVLFFARRFSDDISSFIFELILATMWHSRHFDTSRYMMSASCIIKILIKMSLYTIVELNYF